MIATNRRRFLLGAAGFVGLAVPAGAAAFGCETATSTPPDRKKILEDAAAIVIVPTYEDAAVKVGALVTAMERVQTTPDAASVAAAGAAWRAARTAWKRSDAFLFGPADDLGITGGIIDSSPPDTAKIDKLLSGTSVLDATAVASIGGNQRGFAGLEALLFDPLDPSGIVARFVASERRRLFGVLVAKDLLLKVEAVRDAWLPGKGDYAGELTRAGRGSKTYTAERQGIDALVNALVNGAEVLIAIRLAKPLGLDVTPQTAHPELLESPLSDASIADIVAVLEGLEMLYTCTREGARGLPLGEAVREFRPAGDEALRADFGKAKAALAAVPPPLRTAISSSRESAIAAHAAIREIKRRLATDIAGALGTTVGFGVADGD